MLLTIDNLLRGMRDFLDRPGWPQDFHASFYRKLAERRSAGLSPDWWQMTVPDLASWRATRPMSQATILRRGHSQLRKLARADAKVRKAAAGRPPTMDSLAWEDVAGLYGVAHAVKGSASPVFGSKLCHFILPDAFPVIDRAFVGVAVSDYRTYWTRCKQAWMECGDRGPLVVNLAAHMHDDARGTFPWSTKITELCVAGSRLANAAAR